MSTSAIQRLIHCLRAHDSGDIRKQVPGVPAPFVLVSDAPAQEAWDRHAVEQGLGVKLPKDLIELWGEAAGLRLFVDRTFGQWGLVIWPPEETLVKNLSIRARRTKDLRGGDVVIGEFLGDSDLLLLRCDAACKDYGSIVIMLPIDRPKSWPTIADSLNVFVQMFWDAKGEKYWETCKGE